MSTLIKFILKLLLLVHHLAEDKMHFLPNQLMHFRCQIKHCYAKQEEYLINQCHFAAARNHRNEFRFNNGYFNQQ